jgi:hypothetical protein
VRLSSSERNRPGLELHVRGPYRGVNQISPYDGSSSPGNPASNVATSQAVNGHVNDVLLMLCGALGSPTFHDGQRRHNRIL